MPREFHSPAEAAGVRDSSEDRDPAGGACALETVDSSSVPRAAIAVGVEGERSSDGAMKFAPVWIANIEVK